jgi:non-ribosomal peptide synthetase component E (peptide arylation enzyme)
MDRNDYLVGPPAACDASVLAGLSARDILAATVARTPAGLAYVDGPLRLTWRDAAACVAALADDLERAGIGAGDVVGLRLPNGAAFAIAHLAIAELGAVTLPLHVPYGDAEVREFLAATSARAYVHTGCTGDCRELRDAVPSLAVLVHCAPERAVLRRGRRVAGASPSGAHRAPRAVLHHADERHGIAGAEIVPSYTRRSPLQRARVR